MPLYDAEHKSLVDLLADAAENATLLIPDLQRPYIWSPEQVLRLVDSLLRGWPFGTLLLWDLGIVAQSDELIPSRSFWIVVDRVGGADQQSFARAVQPSQFSMVLDGQQRIQSLLLAFGPESAGLKLLDKEWAETLKGRNPYSGRNVRKHWTKSALYLDLTALCEQLDTDPSEPDLSSDPDFTKLLVWAHSGQGDAQNLAPPRPGNYSKAIESVKDWPGRYIRLARLWDRAAKALNMPDSHIRDMSIKLLEEHNVGPEKVELLWRALRSFVKSLHRVQNTRVEFLKLYRFSTSGYFAQDEYNNAIVNIFTRLNAGGRTLSREEITFAWIKSSWRESDTEHGGAERAIESLRSTVNASDENLRLPTDEIVRMLSTIWSVYDRDGTPVRDRDLLDGKTVRKLADWLRTHWSTLDTGVGGVAQRVADLGLRFNVHYRSVNALTLLVCWRLAYDFRALARSLGSQERDVLLANGDDLVAKHAETWVILSQWAGRWARGTDDAMANYMRQLADVISTASAAESEGEFHSAMGAILFSWLAGLRTDATSFVDTLKVEDRHAVSAYRVPLDLWQRQDNDRRDQAGKVLIAASTRTVPALEVDHILAWSTWASIAAGREADLVEVGNSIGNCTLLTKSFNSRKGVKSLDDWLTEVTGLPGFDATTWKKALHIPDELARFKISAQDCTLEDLRELIISRENEIKRGLRGFVEAVTKIGTDMPLASA